MKPYVHYVPIAHDLSDIREQIDWLRANDDKAAEISNNAMEFAEHYFQKDRILAEIKQTF